VATFHQHLYMEYISVSRYNILEVAVPSMISLIAANKEATEARVPSG